MSKERLGVTVHAHHIFLNKVKKRHQEPGTKRWEMLLLVFSHVKLSPIVLN